MGPSRAQQRNQSGDANTLPTCATRGAAMTERQPNYDDTSTRTLRAGTREWLQTEVERLRAEVERLLAEVEILRAKEDCWEALVNVGDHGGIHHFFSSPRASPVQTADTDTDTAPAAIGSSAPATGAAGGGSPDTVPDDEQPAYEELQLPLADPLRMRELEMFAMACSGAELAHILRLAITKGKVAHVRELVRPMAEQGDASVLMQAIDGEPSYLFLAVKQGSSQPAPLSRASSCDRARNSLFSPSASPVAGCSFTLQGPAAMRDQQEIEGPDSWRGEAILQVQDLPSMAKTREKRAIICQNQGNKDQAVVEARAKVGLPATATDAELEQRKAELEAKRKARAEVGLPATATDAELEQRKFHKSLELEIERGHNCPLPLLFKSMFEHRAENTNFTIPKKETWHDIQCQVVEGKGGKLISNWGLVIRPRGGQAEAVALGLEAAHPLGAVLTAAPSLLVDSRGRRYVHQGEVFGVLMAALLEADNMKKLKKKVKNEYCNITTVVVEDFLRALDVCYYLAGVSAPAGIVRFEQLCPKPDHKAYLQSEYLQNVLPKVVGSLPDADLNAERFQDFLARNMKPATLTRLYKGKGRKGPAVSEMEAPPQYLQLLLTRLCSQMVLSGEIKNQSGCLGAYTLVLGHGRPMWRHESGGSFIAHESGDGYRGTAMAQLVEEAEKQSAIVEEIKIKTSSDKKEELDAAERKLKKLEGEVANGYWAVQKQEGDSVHDCMRLYDANVLFPHKSRVPWKEADGKGGWFDVDTLRLSSVVSLWITVPAGQGPGASVEVEHERRKYQVVVPAGAEAGSVFLGQIQVSAAEGLKCEADPPPADGSHAAARNENQLPVLVCVAASKKRGLDNHAPTKSIQDPRSKQPRVLAGTDTHTGVSVLMGATACTTVVIVGTMDEGQLQDRPFQRRLLGISVAGQYLELGGSENQKHLALVGLLMCLVAAMVIFLVELRRRWQLSCKDPWKNLATGRNCKDLEAALQERLGIDPSEQDLKVLVEGIWFHIERPEVVAGALTAVLKIMAGPHVAKVFRVPAVADEKADENARKAFGVGVLEVTLASMEKHRSRDDVLAPACGVVWAINASPKAVDIRVDTAARGGIPLLCGALGSFDKDPVIVEASLSAMINLMYENDDNKGAVMAAHVRLNNGKEASVVERAIELLNADRLLWYEPSSNGTYLLHAGVQESALNVLRKLANTPPLFTQSTAKELLQGVEAHVQAAMDQPHASVHLKEDGQKFIDNLRRRKNVPEADAHD